LHPGVIYDLPTSIGTCLILNGAAELAEMRAVDEEERIAMNVQTWREIAASHSGYIRNRRRAARPK
jgi:hypothetical protein